MNMNSDPINSKWDDLDGFLTFLIHELAPSKLELACFFTNCTLHGRHWVLEVISSLENTKDLVIIYAIESWLLHLDIRPNIIIVCTVREESIQHVCQGNIEVIPSRLF